MKKFSYPELLDELQSLKHHKKHYYMPEVLKIHSSNKLHLGLLSFNGYLSAIKQVWQNNTTISGIHRGKFVI